MDNRLKFLYCSITEPVSYTHLDVYKRQVSDTPKIYVEDYVDTFLNQICDKADKEQAGAFLVGKKEVTEGQELSLIHI